MNFPPELLSYLRKATHIAALTGAGISAESGVPTFREAQTGLWAKYDPQELATPQAFRRNPQLVWEWYDWRRGLIAAVEPNPGHYALAAMADRAPQFTLITQNIDGLHQQAGSAGVIELHGNIARTKCFTEGAVVETWEETTAVPPHCPRCDGLLRPDVVWFGENLPQQALETAFATAQSCDVFFSIGTSALVHPAAMLPVEAARNGALTVEINPNPTPISSQMDFVLSGPSGEILPALVTAVWGSYTNHTSK